ncbi:MAG: hypothetical protein FD163_1730 [Hyphomonadaceae bacterium]|nr:MAG: hypothetical protein FD128_397 [Hyphomonadaceae bacterium]KAF0185033.1 MAG: hypothetical protein FD163_1730 [Hyphomonadaceae bacterium]
MSDFFTGRILIAAPNMEDPRFKHAIILVCDHDEEHALGIVINRIIPNLTLPHFFEQIGIENAQFAPKQPILEGGPCQQERGFVVHSDEWNESSTISIGFGLALTVTKEIFSAVVDGKTPCKMIVALGYAGWGPGQLESEIVQNAWIVGDASSELIFNTTDISAKWQQSLQAMGIDPRRLSPFAGNA